MEGSAGRAAGSASTVAGTASAGSSASAGASSSSPPAEAVEVLDLLADVGDVEEGVLLEADVDEGGLHPRQDPRHASLVDVSDDAALLAALDLHLGDAAVLEDGDAGLAVVGGDEELFLHGRIVLSAAQTFTNRR